MSGDPRAALPPAGSGAAAPGGGVDRAFTIDELLGRALRRSLQPLVDRLTGSPTALTGTDGELLWGQLPEGNALRVGIELELEPVGHLVSAVTDLPRLRAVAGMLGHVLRQRAQYLLASDLHISAVQADYEALLAKHAELEASEQQLRRLSAELEERVAAQVTLLDQRQRQLYQAEKLASVGQLAAGVAHEINNPIGFIRSNLATARRYLEQLGGLRAGLQAGSGEAMLRAAKAADLGFLLDDFDALLGDCIDGADRVARIVSDLKGFSNVDRSEEEMADVNALLATVCDLVAGRLPAGVSLHRRFGPLPRTRCRPGHLNQVFFNVLDNAIRAVGEHGTIAVSTQAAAAALEVEISDDGCGIAAEHLARVFEPFFTSRQVGEGTGLGLTVARDIVHAHGGEIALTSRADSGTRVVISLPLEAA